MIVLCTLCARIACFTCSRKNGVRLCEHVVIKYCFACLSALPLILTVFCVFERVSLFVPHPQRVLSFPRGSWGWRCYGQVLVQSERAREGWREGGRGRENTLPYDSTVRILLLCYATPPVPCHTSPRPQATAYLPVCVLPCEALRLPNVVFSSRSVPNARCALFV